MYKHDAGDRADPADLRIQQLSELTGLSPLVIRAWERRYGFPAPARSGGGHRRYTREQAEMLHRAALLVRSGFRAHDAVARARLASRELGAGDTGVDGAASLAASLVDTDPASALNHMRRLDLVLGFDYALEELVLPALALVGEMWAGGEVSVAQEHAASGMVLSWLGSLRSELQPRSQPSAGILISAPEGEQHAVAIWALEVLLLRRGVSALALGGDVPVGDLAAEVERRRTWALVMGITRPELLEAVERQVRSLRAPSSGPRLQVFVGGRGVQGLLPPGVRALPSRLTEAAELLARSSPAGSG